MLDTRVASSLFINCCNFTQNIAAAANLSVKLHDLRYIVGVDAL